MRSEQEVLDLVVDTAREDVRIRAAILTDHLRAVGDFRIDGVQIRLADRDRLSLYELDFEFPIPSLSAQQRNRQDDRKDAEEECPGRLLPRHDDRRESAVVANASGVSALR